MPEVTHLFDNADQIIVYMNDGTRAIAWPTIANMWIIGEAGGVVVPPPDTAFMWPFNPDFATSEFGYRTDPFGSGKTVFHTGIDASTSAGVGNGANVLCAGDGTVIAAGNVRSGWGNAIIIDHGTISGAHLMTGYAHMQAGSPFFNVGDSVDKGDVLGLVGSTGASTGAHLHFSTWENGQFINPRNFMAAYGS